MRRSRWGIAVALVAVGLFVSYLPIAWRYPTPLEAETYWMQTHHNILSFHSTFLRFPHDLPGYLAMPRSSGAVNGHDYIYTSQNNLFFIAGSVPATALSAALRLRDGFRFVVYSRLLMVAVAIGIFVGFYALLQQVYGDPFRAFIVSTAIATSWAVYFHAEFVRWTPVTHLLVVTICLAYLRYRRTGARGWRWAVDLQVFLLALLHYVSGLFALGLAAALWLRDRRSAPADALRAPLAATLGVAALLGLAVAAGFAHGQLPRGPGAGPGAVGRYVYNFPTAVVRSVKTTLGRDTFYPAFHSVVPNTVADVTNVVLPPPPPAALRRDLDAPWLWRAVGLTDARTADGRPVAAGGLFSAYGRFMGFNEPMWWSSAGLGARPATAVIGLGIQALALGLVALWWFGRGVVRWSLRRAFGAAIALGKSILWGDTDRALLHRVLLVAVLVYLFLSLEYTGEGVFSAGLLALAAGIALAEGLARVPLTRWSRYRVAAYVVVLAGLNVWYAVDKKVVEPRANPYYAPYVRLVEWARGMASGEPLFFDFPFDHLPAKALIDGPMPWHCCQVPRIPMTACWDFRTVYGAEAPRALIVGVGETRGIDAAGAAPARGDVVRWDALETPRWTTSNRHFLPRPPGGDAHLRLDYVETVALPRGERDAQPVRMTFYAGRLVPRTEARD